MDHGRRLVDGRLPRRRAHPRPARRRGGRPAGLPAQSRRAWRLGQHDGAAPGRDHQIDAGSRGRPHRAGRRRRARRHAAGGRGQPDHVPAARAHRGRLVPGPARGARTPVLARHHGLAGCHHRALPRHGGPVRCLPPGSGGGHPEGHRGGRAVVGQASGAGAGGHPRPQAGHGPRGAVPRHQREDDAGRRGRDAHGRHAGAVPGWCGVQYRALGTRLHRPRRAAPVRDRARSRGIPGPLPRAR